jgi:hypothetical protein
MISIYSRKNVSRKQEYRKMSPIGKHLHKIELKLTRIKDFDILKEECIKKTIVQKNVPYW